jgi:hypothetical protein
MGNSCATLLLKAWIQPEIYLNKNKQQEIQQKQEQQQQEQEEEEQNEDLEQNITSITEKDPNQSITMDEIVENTKNSLSNRLMNKLKGNSNDSSNSSKKNKKAAENARNQRENIIKAKNAFNKQIKSCQSKIKEVNNEIFILKQNILHTTIKSERLLFADKIKRKKSRINELEKKVIEKEGKKAMLEEFEEQMIDIDDELDSEIHLENIDIDPDKIIEIVSRIQEERGIDKVREGLDEAKMINSPYSYDDALERLEEDEDIKNILADIDDEEEAKTIRNEAPTPPAHNPIRNTTTTNNNNRFVLPSGPPPSPSPSSSSVHNINPVFATSGQQKHLHTKSKTVPNISELDD